MIEGQELERELTILSYKILNHLDAARPPQAPYFHAEHNWASEIGHPCRRNLVYCRTRWRERRPMELAGRYRVEEGKKQEKDLQFMLEDVGFEVNMRQVSFLWDKYRLSGKTDGALTLRPESTPARQDVPIEIMTVQPWFWDNTRTIAEIKKHPKFWIRKKSVQLNCYLFMQGLPGGILGIKTFGKRPRILPMLIDYEIGEQSVRTCEAVNAHVEAGTLPDRIEFDATVCGMCDFNHICQPVRIAGLGEIPEALLPDLHRYCDLRPIHEEYQALKKVLIGDKETPGFFRGTNAIKDGITISSTKSSSGQVRTSIVRSEEMQTEDF